MRTPSRCYFLIMLTLLLGVFGQAVFARTPVTSPKLINLDFKNADLKDVLRVLAAQEGANFLIDNEVSGSVTIHLSKITFTEALNIISQTNSLLVTQENNVYRITQVDNSVLIVNYKDGALSIEAKNAKLPNVLKTISEKAGVNLIPAADLKDRITINLNQVPLDNAIETILTQANCVADKRGSTTIISKRTTSILPFKISYQNNLLTIDAQNVPLASLTRAITENTGVSVVPNQDAMANISIYIQNLPLEEALEILCSSNNLSLSRNGNAWVIARSTNQYQGSGQNIKINYNSKDKTFDIDVQMSPLSNIISDMAQKANLNIVIGPEVNWTTNNIHLKKLSFTQTLDFLLKGTIFTYCLIDNTYMVGDGLMIRPENSHYSVAKLYPIKNLKADQLLNTLPNTFPRQSFILILEKNALVVTAPPSVHKLFEDYLAQVDVADNVDRTEVIKIKYLKAEDVLKYLPPSIPRNDIVVVKEINSIAVTGPQNFVTQIKQYIEKIDQVNPLIVFNIAVISVQNNNGFNWTPPSGTITNSDGSQITISDLSLSYSPTPATTGTDSPSLSLTYLLTKLKAKVISNPTITTLNGYPTSFNVSTKRYYPVKSSTTSNGQSTSTTENKALDSGLFVTITPWVADNKITMEIKPKISEYGAIPQGAEIPETIEHSTETTIRVNNKQTVIISGLKNNRKSNSIDKVPLLGDIPLIGLLFRKHKVVDEQEEFIIIITPSLVYNETDSKDSAEKITDKMDPEIKNEYENETKNDKNVTDKN